MYLKYTTWCSIHVSAVSWLIQPSQALINVSIASCRCPLHLCSNIGMNSLTTFRDTEQCYHALTPLSLSSPESFSWHKGILYSNQGGPSLYHPQQPLSLAALGSFFFFRVHIWKEPGRLAINHSFIFLVLLLNTWERTGPSIQRTARATQRFTYQGRCTRGTMSWEQAERTTFATTRNRGTLENWVT